ncbi:MAG: hypothetical protein HC852_17650 [Acaryochloridaceae cyanobacterium RU_4_10]|nr:hypothetical protein [Acaryochloridaceae cyanobacterium RU_4_10]
MKTQTALRTGAIAVVLAASTALSASVASAGPKHDRYRGYDYDYSPRWDRGYRNEYRHHRKNAYRNSARYRNRYPRNEVVALPYGCRKVVIRDRTYYTRDNVYYAYSPERRGYVVVNLFNIGIGF